VSTSEVTIVNFLAPESSLEKLSSHCSRNAARQQRRRIRTPAMREVHWSIMDKVARGTKATGVTLSPVTREHIDDDGNELSPVAFGITPRPDGHRR